MIPKKRSIAAVVASLSLLLTACTSSPAATNSADPTATDTKPLTKLKVGIGFQTPGLMLDAALADLKATGEFEAQAREFGYDLEVNYQTFAFAPEHVTAMQEGSVDIGTMATFPIINQISKGAEMRPLNIAWGGLQYQIAVKKGGPIKTFDDLKGATVALPVGTALQQVFEVFLAAEFGKSAEELGIKYVNQGVPAPFLPDGVDATITWLPVWLDALDAENRELEVLAYLSRVEGGATTGEAYDGPLGKGAGHVIPSVANSPYGSEGFIALRHVFATFGDLPDKHPDVVVAWLVAYQKTLQRITGMSPDEVMDILPADTFEAVSKETYRKHMFGSDLIYDYRKWTWLTEGDLGIMETDSQVMVDMGVLDKALDRKALLEQMGPNLEIMKRAYEIVGDPAEQDFTRADATDVRGRPVWELE